MKKLENNTTNSLLKLSEEMPTAEGFFSPFGGDQEGA